jgi:hypothetical protein
MDEIAGGGSHTSWATAVCQNREACDVPITVVLGLRHHRHHHRPDPALGAAASLRRRLTPSSDARHPAKAHAPRTRLDESEQSQQDNDEDDGHHQTNDAVGPVHQFLLNSDAPSVNAGNPRVRPAGDGCHTKDERSHDDNHAKGTEREPHVHAPSIATVRHRTAHGTGVVLRTRWSRISSPGPPRRQHRGCGAGRGRAGGHRA